MTEYALRYWPKEKKYLVEIKDPLYFELDKQILEARRKELRIQRQGALKCYWIPESAVPAGVSARPIHKLPPLVEELPETEYKKLLETLRKD